MKGLEVNEDIFVRKFVYMCEKDDICVEKVDVEEKFIQVK